MTEEHRKNLEKLATYLSLKELKADFDMSTYCEDFGEYKTTCGTVGCAVGHGPYAGIPKLAKETWNRYVSRAFGIDTDLDEAFDYLFSCDWTQVDNTAQGAAYRIRFYLDHGIPENFNLQDLIDDEDE